MKKILSLVFLLVVGVALAADKWAGLPDGKKSNRDPLGLGLPNNGTTVTSGKYFKEIRVNRLLIVDDKGVIMGMWDSSGMTLWGKYGKVDLSGNTGLYINGVLLKPTASVAERHLDSLDESLAKDRERDKTQAAEIRMTQLEEKVSTLEMHFGMLEQKLGVTLPY